MAHPTREKLSALYLHLFNLLWTNLCFVSIASCFDWGFRFLLCICRLCWQSIGICYIVWFAIYLPVVEFVICTLHPCVTVSAAECAVCSICFGLVAPAVTKTHALYVESGQCIRRSVWFICLAHPVSLSDCQIWIGLCKICFIPFSDGKSL